MIYRAIQLIQIFAHGRADGRTKVFQEVLADLKIAVEAPRDQVPKCVESLLCVV